MYSKSNRTQVQLRNNRLPLSCLLNSKHSGAMYLHQQLTPYFFYPYPRVL